MATLIRSFEERIQICQDALAALKNVRSRLSAAKDYESRNKHGLLDVTLFKSAIENITAGCYSSLVNVQNSIIQNLESYNPEVWQYRWGVAFENEGLYTQDDDAPEGGRFGIRCDPSPNALSLYHFGLASTRYGKTDALLTTVDFAATVDFFDGWTVDDVFEVYDAENPENNGKYKAAAVFTSSGNTYGITVSEAAPFRAPRAFNEFDKNMKFRKVMSA